MSALRPLRPPPRRLAARMPRRDAVPCNPTPSHATPPHRHGRYLLLLRSARVAIKTGRATPLSAALEFLHRDFEENYYAWEIVEQVHPHLKLQAQLQS